MQYSLSFNKYVQKCRSRAKTPADSQFLDRHIAQLAEQAMQQNHMWIRNWMMQPIPTLPSEQHNCSAPSSAPQGGFSIENMAYEPGPALYTGTNGIPPCGSPPHSALKASQSNATLHSPVNLPPSHRPNGKRIPMKPNAKSSALPTSQAKKRKRHTPQPKKNKRSRSLKTHLTSLPTIDFDRSSRPLVGTCKKLEKDYVRLTEAVKPSNVRPQDVLERTLSLLKRKYIKEYCSYDYLQNQFKSMRQDLVVQNIKNSFTVRVYESHARIALQHGDLNQFNQCQSQLKDLYLQGVPGHREEFTAYRIMYYAFIGKMESLVAELRELSSSQRKNQIIEYAIEVAKTVTEGNMHRLFTKLLSVGPKMSGDLVEHFANKKREDFLFALGKAHNRTKLPRDYLMKTLGIQSKKAFASFVKKYSLPTDEEEYMAKDVLDKINQTRQDRKLKN